MEHPLLHCAYLQSPLCIQIAESSEGIGISLLYQQPLSQLHAH